ncbi:kinase-like domain-containing protein [Aspergillus flavus]|uniref:non-specific serine/threonine protein kinase n=1 Tax=Aspergillus flavus TaxID=5059 RepID=A0A5N6GZL4_ASPFL|nr:kinase-like domain-containing protein [Aspergillus flavus]
MSQLLSSCIRLLRPRILSPVLREARMPHRCAFAITAYNSMVTNDDFQSEILYEPLEGVERLENYRPGGYRPIQVGDHLHDRYQIIHKLGHGSYSTTWLARDEQNNNYVAVKICTGNSNPREIDILSILTHPCDPAVKSPGKTTVPSIVDTFTIHSPNSNYAYYVTVPARASFSGLRIIHGDLHIGNILLKSMPNFDQLSLDPVVHLNNKPLPPEVLSHARILLTDSGKTFLYSEELKYKSHTPLVIRPPEARFEPNTPLPLFEGFLATEDDMTCEHVDTLGFTEDGTPINRNPYRSWRDRFEDSVQQPRRDSGMPVFDAKERAAIFDMLRPMLSFKPENRSTTKQILETEWMVKWALAEYEKGRKYG